MKKTAILSIFLFLTGLFSGLFFSTGLSPDNHTYLSSLLISGISSSSGFFRGLASSLLSNLALVSLMLPALFTKLLCPLPLIFLFYKSFSMGFCGGLIQTSTLDNAFLVSLLKFFPQNLFFIPAFIILTSVIFDCSVTGPVQKNRSSRERKDLKNIYLLSFVLILAGCVTQESCRLIAL